MAGSQRRTGAACSCIQDEASPARQGANQPRPAPPRNHSLTLLHVKACAGPAAAAAASGLQQLPPQLG